MHIKIKHGKMSEKEIPKKTKEVCLPDGGTNIYLPKVAYLHLENSHDNKYKRLISENTSLAGKDTRL